MIPITFHIASSPYQKSSRILSEIPWIDFQLEEYRNLGLKNDQKDQWTILPTPMRNMLVCRPVLTAQGVDILGHNIALKLKNISSQEIKDSFWAYNYKISGYLVSDDIDSLLVLRLSL